MRDISSDFSPFQNNYTKLAAARYVDSPLPSRGCFVGQPAMESERTKGFSFDSISWEPNSQRSVSHCSQLVVLTTPSARVLLVLLRAGSAHSVSICLLADLYLHTCSADMPASICRRAVLTCRTELFAVRVILLWPTVVAVYCHPFGHIWSPIEACIYTMSKVEQYCNSFLVY
jgi:hypothetical protein